MVCQDSVSSACDRAERLLSSEEHRAVRDQKEQRPLHCIPRTALHRLSLVLDCLSAHSSYNHSYLTAVFQHGYVCYYSNRSIYCLTGGDWRW